MTTETDVLERETPIPPVPDKGQGAGQVKTYSQADVDRLQRQLDDERADKQYWRSTAGKGKEPEPEPAGLDTREFLDDEEDKGLEGDTAEKLVDELSSQGIGALKKRGFVTVADAKKIAAEVGVKVAQTLIDRTTTRMVSDAQLFGDFPDLRVESSELVKATGVIYRKLIAMDKSAEKSPVTMYAAAEAAKAQLEAKAAKVTPKARPVEDDDDPYDRVEEPEADRRRRVSAQDGSRNGRGSRSDDEGESNLGPQAKALAAAFGLKDEEYSSAKQRIRGRG